MVMVSHRLTIVMDFEQVIVMDSGAIVEMGTPKQLLEGRGLKAQAPWLAKSHHSARAACASGCQLSHFKP
ncbi:hypothetical protein F5Y17DRAFT_229810 [Xylariaceae sp. FL0594]|nr:hypothetical protein F5Y17DRAFT_229810 [Xylariaceae sp. FL0594]